MDHELDTYAQPAGATEERRADIHRMLDTVAERVGDRMP